MLLEETRGSQKVYHSKYYYKVCKSNFIEEEHLRLQLLLISFYGWLCEIEKTHNLRLLQGCSLCFNTQDTYKCDKSCSATATRNLNLGCLQKSFKTKYASINLLQGILCFCISVAYSMPPPPTLSEI